MKTLLILFWLIHPFTYSGTYDCKCDKGTVEKIISQKDFPQVHKLDSTKFNAKEFYNFSAEDNRTLWFQDIENPYPTSFTKLWDDYSENNYHASHLDFIKEYEHNKEIELAFQFGPNYWDLWAYSLFTVRQVNCCYLVTRSYFRHARFTYKAYSIVDSNQLDSLYLLMNSLNKREANESLSNCGYFIDNKHKQNFYINFDRDTIEVPTPRPADSLQNPGPAIYKTEYKPEIKLLLNFIYKRIDWKITYSL